MRYAYAVVYKDVAAFLLKSLCGGMLIATVGVAWGFAVLSCLTLPAWAESTTPSLQFVRSRLGPAGAATAEPGAINP